MTHRAKLLLDQLATEKSAWLMKFQISILIVGVL